MRILLKVATTAVAISTLAVGPASGQVFVGSWRVDAGPSWTTVPTAYTGLAAAAFLFGGSPSDYLISTIDNTSANIDNMAWYSTWGGACGGVQPCGTKYGENYSNSALYQTTGDVSAYVDDWAYGEAYTNYAFQVEVVPEPATMTLLATGLAGMAAARRRRKKA